MKPLRKRAELGVALFYLAIVVALLWPSIFLGQMLLPGDILLVLPPWNLTPPSNWHGCSNCLLSDQVFQFYPWGRYTLERLQSLQIPLWDPYVLAGVPFQASPQTAVFYPVNLLRLVLPFDRTLVVSAMIRLLIAGWFTYRFGRELGFPRTSSTVAGLAFMLSEFNVARRRPRGSGPASSAEWRANGSER